MLELFFHRLTYAHVFNMAFIKAVKATISQNCKQSLTGNSKACEMKILEENSKIIHDCKSSEL